MTQWQTTLCVYIKVMPLNTSPVPFITNHVHWKYEYGRCGELFVAKYSAVLFEVYISVKHNYLFTNYAHSDMFRL